MSNKYNHRIVEAKWRANWVKNNTYVPDLNSRKKKFYNLMMFPYPSAEGLHAGNMFAFTGSDVYGRFKRMSGYEVLEPIGLDGFGIHSENYAIKVGTSPQINAKRAEKNFYRQLKEIGNGFDWTRSLETYDPDYYIWTQWLFIELFKAGLAYRKEASVNWCPSCKTVLADEQVMPPRQAGKLPVGYNSYDEVPENLLVCERCGSEIYRKKLEQWFFKITSDSNRLLRNLEKIKWSERVKTAQKNWIGKKRGVNITYIVEDTDIDIICWTSRPETNFGATFVVVSPDNPIVDGITTSKYKSSVTKYIEKHLSVSKANYDKNDKKKTGVFTGSYAINNLNGDRLPIWVSDFVLMEVGTGVVVGVPGHDKRDFEFAQEFGIPVRRVIVGLDGDKSEICSIEQVQDSVGNMINSDFLDGLDIKKAKKKMVSYLVDKGWAKRSTHYHLRDWLISRQRYWGPPIPMIYCKSCADKGISWFNTTLDKKTRGLDKKNDKQTSWESAGWFPDENLPVILPEIEDYIPKGNGRGPLSDHPEFYEVSCPNCGNTAHRETDVSDTFLDSSWYFLRYPSIDTKNSTKRPFDTKITKKWLPVDLYFGGAEHAVLHLMYARFVTHILHDLGHLDFEEPFPMFYAHGLMIKDGAKMSKSKGNIVNPDVYIEKFGADTLRLYLMFMGPMGGNPDFRDTGIEGMRRFTERIWELLTNYRDIEITDKEELYNIQIKMHQTIRKVTNDIESFKYNTAIAGIMEYVNTLRSVAQSKKQNAKGGQAAFSFKSSAIWGWALEALVKMLAPFAPHLTEEVWVEKFGKSGSVHKSVWPEYNEEFVSDLSVTVAIQVNGKLRATLKVPISDSSNEAKIVELVKKNSQVYGYLQGMKVKRTVFVPGKILNFVLNM